MEQAQIRQEIRTAVIAETRHSSLAEAARQRRQLLEALIREQLPTPEEPPPDGWPRTHPHDLTDLAEGIDFQGTRNVQDRVLRVAHAAGHRQMGVNQVTDLILRSGRHLRNDRQHHSSTRHTHDLINLRSIVRATLIDNPELYERTGTGTFRYRWA